MPSPKLNVWTHRGNVEPLTCNFRNRSTYSSNWTQFCNQSIVCSTVQLCTSDTSQCFHSSSTDMCLSLPWNCFWRSLASVCCKSWRKKSADSAMSTFPFWSSSNCKCNQRIASKPATSLQKSNCSHDHWPAEDSLLRSRSLLGEVASWPSTSETMINKDNMAENILIGCWGGIIFWSETKVNTSVLFERSSKTKLHLLEAVFFGRLCMKYTKQKKSNWMAKTTKRTKVREIAARDRN